MKTELSKELHSLLELLVNPIDDNFELGKCLLPNYYGEIEKYLFGGDIVGCKISYYSFSVNYLVRGYYFYKFWFSKVEFDSMCLVDLYNDHLSFIRWHQGKISTLSFCRLISIDGRFKTIFDPEDGRVLLTSIHNGQVCKSIKMRAGEVGDFNRKLDF